MTAPQRAGPPGPPGPRATAPRPARRGRGSTGTGWRSRTATLAALIAALGAGAASATAQAPPVQGLATSRAVPTIVLDHVTVVDVEHGRRLRDQRVVLVGNRIRTLGRSAAVKIPPGARVVDARGQYLIPGLWDMHMHPAMGAPWPRADVIYRELVANGITGLRDPGSIIPLDTFRVWKQEIAAGRRVAPRLIVSGPSINFGDRAQECERDPHGACRARINTTIARPEDARPLVDSLKAAGADMIKLREMPRALWLAAAAAARRAGMLFGGHFNLQYPGDTLLPRTVDGLMASDSGARILDHYMWADVCGEGRDTLLSLPRCVAAAARLRRNHTWVAYLDDPTREGMDELASDSFRARALRYTPLKRGPLQSADDSAWQPPSAAERRHRPTGADWAAALPDSVRQGRGCQRALLAYAADVPWMPGPDFPTTAYPASVHLSLLRPVLCGVPPLWALQAATLTPARALGLTDSLGTVAQGKVADLVLLEGDPLADIWNVTKIAAVVANGRYFDRAALDRLLAAADAEWQQTVEAQQRVEAQAPSQPSPPQP